MATKHAVGTADIDFVRLGIPKRLGQAGIIAAFWELQRKIRYGGLSRRERWLHRFDAGVTDLSVMPIGLFEAKAIILPRMHLPQTKKALLSFCRQLIDRGENEGYIAIVLRGWLDGWSLERHVDVLWGLRENHRRFFEDVVRGRHRRALSRLNEVAAAGALTEEGGRDLIRRQGLLWCAMDVQMVTCGARASMIMPFGRLIRMTMKVFKAGTALRLMHRALAVLEVVCGQYQTLKEEEDAGPNGAKPTGMARRIYLAVEQKWPERGRTVEEDRADLDDGISYIRGRLPEMRARMSFYEDYLVDADAGGTVVTERRKDNRLRHFHAIWYSGLSPAAGMAVALTRLTMAERELGDLVARASLRAREGQSGELLPLPPLPTDPEMLEEMEERVLDLAHAARVVHLRDEDCLSRTRKGKPLEHMLALDPDILIRDPLDKAGLTFILDAFAFLQAMGQRPRDAYVQCAGRDPRIYTYWKMDCVPEIRLEL